MNGGGTTGGTPTGSGNSTLIQRASPAPVHGDPAPPMNVPAQKNVGNPQGVGHPGVVDDRGSGGRTMPGQRGDFGDHHLGDRDHGFHGRHGDHDFGRRHGVVVFVVGVPYYCYYPGLYYPNAGYYNSTPYYAPDSSTGYTPVPDAQTASQDAQGFYQPGYQWGGELRDYHVTMDQLVAYLKSYVLNSSAAQQAAFRSGFIANFGTDGQTVYDQAMQQASQST
jgi:hypothetical protein